MSLELIQGPMFSGKTEALIRRLETAHIAGLRVAAAKPSIDGDRYWIVSLAGPRWPARAFDRAEGLHSLAPECDVLGIDEVQFFDPAVVDVVNVLSQSLRVVAAGLDLDFRARPFQPMPALVSLAEIVTTLTAVCAQCGRRATRSQRLIDGQPAPLDSPTVVIGGAELYEARCETCYLAD